MSEWGVFEPSTGVLWGINPPTKQQAKLVAKSFSEKYSVHIAVPLKWGDLMSDAYVRGYRQGAGQND